MLTNICRKCLSFQKLHLPGSHRGRRNSLIMFHAKRNQISNLPTQTFCAGFNLTLALFNHASFCTSWLFIAQFCLFVSRGTVLLHYLQICSRFALINPWYMYIFQFLWDHKELYSSIYSIACDKAVKYSPKITKETNIKIQILIISTNDIENDWNLVTLSQQLNTFRSFNNPVYSC